MRNLIFTDLHGQKWAYDAIMAASLPSDNLLFLGDAIDRGPDSYYIMRQLLSDPRVTYLLGNHERFAITELSAALRHGEHLDPDLAIANFPTYHPLWYRNGGLPTYKAWIRDGAPASILEQLAHLPLTHTIGSYDFCHSGCWRSEWDPNDPFIESNVTWNRDHFSEPWFPGRTLIHGHTPTSPSQVARPAYNKINLDTGAFHTGTFCYYILGEDAPHFVHNDSLLSF